MGGSCSEESQHKQHRRSAVGLRAQNLNWEEMLGGTEAGGEMGCVSSSLSVSTAEQGSEDTLPCACQHRPSGLGHLHPGVQSLSTPL